MLNSPLPVILLGHAKFDKEPTRYALAPVLSYLGAAACGEEFCSDLLDPVVWGLNYDAEPTDVVRRRMSSHGVTVTSSASPQYKD